MFDQAKKTAKPVLGAAAVAVLLGLPVACSEDSGGPEEGVTVDELEDVETNDLDTEALALIGTTVTISGDVTNSLSDHAFVLEGSAPDLEVYPVFGDDSEGVLVIQSGGTDWVIDDLLQVTGEVVLFDTTSAETDLGINLDDDLLAPYAGRIAIEATSVDPLPDDD